MLVDEQIPSVGVWPGLALWERCVKLRWGVQQKEKKMKNSLEGEAHGCFFNKLVTSLCNCRVGA